MFKPFMYLLLMLALMSPASALAQLQRPCEPSRLSTHCQLERDQNAAEAHRAAIQRNMEELQRLQRERETQERRRKADCLARLGKNDNRQLCDF